MNKILLLGILKFLFMTFHVCVLLKIVLLVHSAYVTSSSTVAIKHDWMMALKNLCG